MENMDRIERSVVIRAPRDRVWRAISDPAAFGAWFRARIDGAFAVGAVVDVESTYPGHEGTRWQMRIEAIEPGSLFAFTWPSDEAQQDPADWNRVEFRLEEVAEGTRLTVTESGFDRIPPERRARAFRGNEEGWSIQVENVRRHVEA